MSQLFIESWGAVTPVGLSSLASSAAVRAGISRIFEHPFDPPPAEPLMMARVKASWRLKRTPSEWLLNLAHRALDECLAGLKPSTEDTLILLCPPEASRKHPGLEEFEENEFLESLARRTKRSLHASSRLFMEGPAAFVQALELARAVLAQKLASRVVVGGVDCLAQETDIVRLRKMQRLHEAGNPQGVIPGEGAAFLALSLTGRESPFVPLGTVRGVAMARESNPATSENYSTGDALTDSVRRALADAPATPEANITLVVSNHNGERYAAWESLVSQARSYRTRRERLPVLYPASSVGELGAAAGPFAAIVAATSKLEGPAVCELRSEGPLRGAFILGPAPVPAFLTPAKRRPAKP
jgi:3-oxoacyl-[acyl-carrier-protein] synthase-1